MVVDDDRKRERHRILLFNIGQPSLYAAIMMDKTGARNILTITHVSICHHLVLFSRLHQNERLTPNPFINIDSLALG
jgi:hypothetical protein